MSKNAKQRTSKAASAAKPKAKPQLIKMRPPGQNPLLETWATPFQMPPFDRIAIEHFVPAFDKGFAANRKEIAAIVGNTAAPTFANTIEALERSGDILDRAATVFYNLGATDTNEEIQAIERAMAPRFAKHGMRIYQDETLFARVDALFKKRKKLKLSEEQVRVLERYHRAFVKSGAGLEPKAKKRMAAIAARMSVLGTHFSQNLLADEQAFVLVLDGEKDLAGLPEAVRAAAAQTAEERGHKGKHAITLSRSSIEPFLQYSAQARSAREGVQRLDHARRQRRQDRQPQDRGRDPGSAGRAGAAAGLQDGSRLGARILHGQDARQRAQAADGGVGTGAQPRGRGARSAAEGRAGRGRQLRARGVGLALLRGEGAQGQVRRRRRGDQALPATRQRHRRGLRRGGQAVRRHLQRAHRSAHLPSRRAHLRGQARRQARRPVPGRLLRPALQALGRLDVGLAQAGEARRATSRRSSSTS